MEKEADSKQTSREKVSFYFSYRFLLAGIGFFGYSLQYIQKIDMGIGIVCMVNNTAILKPTNSGNNFSIPFSNVTNSSSDDQCYFKHSIGEKRLDGPFVWSKKNQGLILSSYFYGYILSQILAGILAAKFGSKIMLFIGIFFGSFLTLLVPVAARLSYIALIVCRFLTGIFQSFFMPGMSSLWVYWAPPEERSRLIGMSHAGGMIGNIIALLFGGYLCYYGFDGGWPSIFYVFGGAGMIWTIILLIFFSDTPMNNKFISKSEKEYIMEKTKNVTFKKNIDIPWKSIMTSKSCLAIFISHFSNNWGIYLFITELPSFMKEVLKFDIKSNGLMSSIPFFACWVFINISSLLGDRIIKSGKLSKKCVRKIFNGLGLGVPVVTLLCLSFVTCSTPYAGIAILAIGMGFMGCSLGAGYYVNINEIGGRYSGVIFGISNTFGSIPGLIAPYITSVITSHQTQKEWQVVFVICACVYLFGFLVYTFLADTETPAWAQDENSYEEKKRKINS